MDDAERGANATLSIDLPAQEIRGPDGGVVKFEIDPFRKQCLLEGLDDIGLTLVEAPAIAAHEKKSRRRPPVAVGEPHGSGRTRARHCDPRIQVRGKRAGERKRAPRLPDCCVAIARRTTGVFRPLSLRALTRTPRPKAARFVKKRPHLDFLGA